MDAGMGYSMPISSGRTSTRASPNISLPQGFPQYSSPLSAYPSFHATGTNNAPLQTTRSPLLASTYPHSLPTTPRTNLRQPVQSYPPRQSVMSPMVSDRRTAGRSPQSDRASFAGIMIQPAGSNSYGASRPQGQSAQQPFQRGRLQPSPLNQPTDPLLYGASRGNGGLAGAIPSTAANRVALPQNLQNLQNLQTSQSLELQQNRHSRHSRNSRQSVQSMQSLQSLQSQSSIQLPPFDITGEEGILSLPPLNSPDPSAGELFPLLPTTTGQSDYTSEVNQPTEQMEVVWM